MAQTAYGDISPRTAAWAVTELLKVGIPFLNLERFAQTTNVPLNKSKVVKFRRYEPFANTPTTLTEGVTPSAIQLTATDVTVTLLQYYGLTQTTDVVMDTHEDPILQVMIQRLGEQAAQMIELTRWNAIIAGTNVFYANGTARSAVNTPMTLALQRKATRALKRQNAMPINKALKSSPDYEAAAVGAAYFAFIHPDLESDIRNFNTSGNTRVFIPVEQYGTITSYESEIGKVESVRYLTSTLYAAYTGAGNKGGAVGTMMPNDADATAAAVYPVIIMGRDAFGTTPLKGKASITPTVVQANPSAADPLAQRAYAGWKSMQASVILNDAWLIRLEVAATL